MAGKKIKDPENTGKYTDYMKGLSLLVWISWEILALTGFGLLVGWALNRWAQLPLAFTLLFALMGLVAAFYRIYQASKTLEKQK